MGVLAASRALGLDFVPVAVEQYDLVIPTEYLEDEKTQRLLEVIRTTTSRTGSLLWAATGWTRREKRCPSPWLSAPCFGQWWDRQDAVPPNPLHRHESQKSGRGQLVDNMLLRFKRTFFIKKGIL